MKPDEARATWWPGVTAGTRYWRCSVPAKHLPGLVLSLTPGTVTEPEPGRYEFPLQRGPAIFQFLGNATRATVAAEMQEQGIRVLMEVDDNYLVHPSHYGVHSSWREFMEAGDDQNTIQAHCRYATWVDGIVVSTPWLAHAYSQFNRNVYVCPNSVDPDDWPEPEKPGDGVLRIGWAASSSHAVDAHLVRRALSWASRQPDVEVVILGDRFFDGFRYTHVPWTDTLAEYRKSLQVLDIGLCPLVNTQWSRAKSDVKALEYAMAGAMSIVSRVEPYKPWLDQPCLTAASAKDFEQQVRWCVKNRDEVKRIAAEAKDYVMRERTIQKHIAAWEEAL